MANIYNDKSNTVISGTSGNDYIQNLGGNISIYGGAGNDNIYVLVDSSNSSSGKNVTVSGGKGNDSIANSSNRKVVYEYNEGDGYDEIFGYNVNDTLKINAASYSTLISGDDFVVMTATGYVALRNSSTIPIKIKDTSGRLTTYNSGKEKIIRGTNYNDELINTNDGVAILAFAGNDSIYNNANNLFIDGNAGNDFIYSSGDKVSIYANSGDDIVALAGDNALIVGVTGNDTISFQGKGNTIDGGEGDDLLINSSKRGGNFFVYGTGGGNDTIQGFLTNDTLQIYNGFVSKADLKGNDVILTIGTGTLTLKNIKKQTVTVLGSNNVTYTGRINANNEITQIVTNSTTSPMTLESAFKSIDASKRTKAIRITGNDFNNSIVGGSGNDTLSGKLGNDTLYGGGGKDVFIYSAGNDVIADYTAGQDKIKLFNASIKSSTVSGSDVVFTLSTGKLTVTGGKNQNITIIDANGNETSKKYGASTASTLKTVTNSTSSPVTVGSAVKTIDASTRTTAVKITGNSLANTIKGGSGNDSLVGGDGKDTLSGGKGNDKLYGNAGNDSLLGGDGKDLLYGQAGDDKIYGQAGNDSLYGGSGNDSLWGGVGNDLLKGGKGNDWLKGGDGSDTFIYGDGDGKDIISGFDNGDLLQITGTFSTSYNSSKREIYFKVGSTAKAITLTDFGSTTTFHVNNNTYQLSGNQFKKR